MSLSSSTPPRFFQQKFRTACDLYREVYDLKEPIDVWFGHFFRRNKQFGSSDRKFLSEVIYACFRHRLFSENWAVHLFPKKDSREWWQVVLLVSMVREKIIDFNSAQEIFKLTLDEFNQIQKGDLPPHLKFKNPLEELSIRESFPMWLLEIWNKSFGFEETSKLCTSLNQRPPLIIRTNTLQISRDELIASFKSRNIEVQKTSLSPLAIRFKNRFNVFELEEFKKGLFEVQDEGSQMIALTINPKSSDVVWDVCAGAGGKTLHLAALMKNKGRIIATDIRDKKLQDLSRRLKRAGVFNVFTADLNRLNESKVIQKGVDRMLIDAPCSGTGTLRRNPDAKWKISPQMIQECHTKQLFILDEYCSHVKPGGRLFYATCSLQREENELTIERFVQKHPEFKLESSHRWFPHQDTTDGFFEACLIKN